MLSSSDALALKSSKSVHISGLASELGSVSFASNKSGMAAAWLAMAAAAALAAFASNSAAPLAIIPRVFMFSEIALIAAIWP